MCTGLVFAMFHFPRDSSTWSIMNNVSDRVLAGTTRSPKLYHRAACMNGTNHYLAVKSGSYCKRRQTRPCISLTVWRNGLGTLLHFKRLLVSYRANYILSVSQSSHLRCWCHQASTPACCTQRPTCILRIRGMYTCGYCTHRGNSSALIEAIVLLADYIAIPRSGSVRGTAHDTLRLTCRGKPRLRGHCAV